MDILPLPDTLQVNVTLLQKNTLPSTTTTAELKLLPGEQSLRCHLISPISEGGGGGGGEDNNFVAQVR